MDELWAKYQASPWVVMNRGVEVTAPSGLLLSPPAAPFSAGSYSQD